MAMFTFIMEFRGGTYVSQVKAASVAAAFVEWSKRLQVDEIQYLGPTGKAEIIGMAKEAEPTLLKGLINVWFESFAIKQGFARVNIVKTVSQ
jgi:hypothetical protein